MIVKCVPTKGSHNYDVEPVSILIIYTNLLTLWFYAEFCNVNALNDSCINKVLIYDSSLKYIMQFK